MTWLATRALLLPAAASSAIRVSRTLTMANSDNTKKALTKISRKTPTILSAVPLIGGSPGGRATDEGKNQGDRLAYPYRYERG